MMVLMLFKQILIPQPLYRALPWVAGVVGAIGFVAAGQSMLLLAASCAVMTYGLLIMVVRMCLEGLSNAR
jgi:hypothetical protein